MFDRGLDYRHAMQGSPCDVVQRSLPIRKSRNESGFLCVDLDQESSDLFGFVVPALR